MSAAAAAGANQPLASLFVEFVQKGLPQLQQSMDGLHKQIDALSKAVASMGEQMTRRLDEGRKKTEEARRPVVDLQQAFERISSTINVSLGIAVASITGFVHQGLALGTTGQLMQLQMERLALSITGLFRPELLKVTELIERLTRWIDHLSAQQKESIARWVEAGAAALAMAVVLPRVVAGLAAAAAAVKLLGAALGILEASTGIGAILPVVGLLLQGITALTVGTEAGRSALAQMGEALKPLAAAFGHLFDALGGVDALMEQIADSMLLLVPAIEMVTRAVEKLTAALGEMEASGGFLRILKQGFEVSTGLTALRGLYALLGVEPPHPHRHGHTSNRGPEPRRSTGFEAVEDVYKRIAQASVGVKPAEERQVDVLQMIYDAVRRAVDLAANTPRPVT